MQLTAGTRLGAYEIVAPLGAGGMGEVYRARDTRLGREVAIKTLPSSVAADPDRLARFEREAQLLAALNHPHIATIHGIEAGAVSFIVMELVDGESLAERLTHGALPIDEALKFARQIADALQAAHLKGIVHRDLKPGNVMLTSDGRVKVLDFGLAKIAEPAAPSAPLNQMTPASPTFTSPATELGVILGTAGYMAPEQARGKAVDKRADVWALGCVIFEMLTGRRPFHGENVTETIAAVLRAEPDWTALPRGLSPTVERYLRKCFEKNPQDRVQDAGDMRLAIDGAFDVAPAVVSTGARAPRWPLALAALAGVVVGALALLFLLPRDGARTADEVKRLSIVPAGGTSPFFDSAESALSPDGRFLVYRTGKSPGDSQLWLRALDAVSPRALEGTAHGVLPFWSPDGKRIGFFADQKLKTLAIDSGAVTVVCDAPNARGGSWSASGTIVFAPAPAGPLVRVPADGGDPVPATALDTVKGETAHRFPQFLPDGRHFLFVALPRRDNRFDVFVGSIDAPDRVLVTSASSAAVYAQPGYLLFTRGAALVAQPFDAASSKVTGQPVSLADIPGGVSAEWLGGPAVSAARTGAISYFGGAVRQTKFTWLDVNAGRETGTVDAPPGLYTRIAISPDGKRAAVDREDSPAADIWVLDLERGGATRLTNGPGRNTQAVWSPDGRRIAFSSERSGQSELYLKDASGGAPETLLLGAGLQFMDGTWWTPSGTLLFNALDRETQQDIWMLDVDGDRKPVPYVRTRFNEFGAKVSPGGRHALYLSTESGALEVFVTTFPRPGEKYRVSNGGVVAGNWVSDSRIVYLTANTRDVMEVDVLATSPFRTSPPRRAGTLPADMFAGDVLPDSSKVLLSVPSDRNPVATLTVVLNWTAAIAKHGSGPN